MNITALIIYFNIIQLSRLSAFSLALAKTVSSSKLKYENIPFLNQWRTFESTCASITDEPNLKQKFTQSLQQEQEVHHQRYL